MQCCNVWTSRYTPKRDKFFKTQNTLGKFLQCLYNITLLLRRFPENVRNKKLQNTKYLRRVCAMFVQEYVTWRNQPK
jgi:hypothetical protein